MHHPTRGGARGGAAEFSWDKVKESKDREFYLGNSVAAPTGRWQDGRDINWYNKDKNASASDAAEERREELRKIKEAETAALYAKLGRPPPSAAGEAGMMVGDRLASGSSGAGRREVTGTNSVPLDTSRSKWGKVGDDEMSEADKKLARKFAREEVRRRRAAAGDDDVHPESRQKARDEDRKLHSSRRHDDDANDDRRRRHDHHRSSTRHTDDDRDGKHSRRHHHRRHSRNSRSRSRSPDQSSRHRRRDHEEERHGSRGSSSRKEREHRDAQRRHHSHRPRDSDDSRMHRDG